jgi:uncharacterized protein (TIGR03435 family)
MRIAIIISVAVGLCRAQTPMAHGPQFEVASIKPSAMPLTNHAFTMSDTRVDLGSMPLSYLIHVAYKVEPYQISGPEWLATTRYDIVAKLPEGATKQQIPEMLQALLEDRFKFTAHHEPVEQKVYALVTGKNGPKLKDAAADNHLDTEFLNGRAVVERTTTEEGDGYWTISGARADPSGTRLFDAPRITMPEFALSLTRYVDLPVVDMTGLNGYWHVTLDVPLPVRQGSMVAQARAAAGLPAPDPAGDVSISASVQKLGLALEKRTAPIDHLVIDHAEKTPTEN